MGEKEKIKTKVFTLSSRLTMRDKGLSIILQVNINFFKFLLIYRFDRTSRTCIYIYGFRPEPHARAYFNISTKELGGTPHKL